MRFLFLLILSSSKLFFASAQESRLSDLLRDIQNAKIIGNNVDKNYSAISKIKGFDSYIYLTGTLTTDTLQSIALMKDSTVKGVLTACSTCTFYSSIKITSKNIHFPSLALSTKDNGTIDRATFKMINKQTVTVGDNNNDKRIDYASYFMGDGLYGILLMSHKLDSITGYLIFNSLKQEYIGILTFKQSGHKKVFDKCFVKAGANWNCYNISGKKTLYISSQNESQLLQKEFPDIKVLKFDETNNKIDSSLALTQGVKFAELMKSNYLTVRSKWLNDFKIILNSNVIGLRLPKLILSNSQTNQIKSNQNLHRRSE